MVKSRKVECRGMSIRGKTVRGRTSRGFTMLETIVVVALIAISLAIIIPSAVELRKNLKITELDDYAREIYITAQNRLTAMKTTGELLELEEYIYSTYSGRNVDPSNNHNLGELDDLNDVGGYGNLNMMPEDYALDNSEWTYLYYFSRNDADVMEYILPSGSIAAEIAEGFYILEFNPTTGDMYSVIYLKSREDYDGSYFKIRDTLEDEYGRSRSIRKDLSPMIGYYSGNIGSAAADLPEYFPISISAVNSEELYAVLKIDDVLPIYKWQEHLTVKITLSNTAGVKKTAVLRGGDNFSITDKSITLYILLDSMAEGYNFARLTDDVLYYSVDGVAKSIPFSSDGDENFTPGEDIIVTADVSFNYKTVQIGKQGDPSCTVNSLFASHRTGEGGARGKITVSALRHLNNLRESIFSAEIPYDVTQTSDIDFSSDENFHWVSGVYKEAAENPLSKFTPITNGNLFTGGSYDGGNFKLHNFYVDEASSAGIFGALSGTTLKDIRVVDPLIRGGENVGALAASISGCTVDNCGVYLSTTNINNVRYVDMPPSPGKESIYDNMMDERTATYTISGSSKVGGLFGTVTNGTAISGSYAAIVVTPNAPGGATAIGGAVGEIKSSTVVYSYSSGDVYASSVAGGFAGDASSTSFDNCYSTSDVFSGSVAGGFIGRGEGVSASDCNVYGKVLKSDGTDPSGAGYGAFYGTGSVICTNCKYLVQTDYNKKLSVQSGVAATSYNNLEAQTKLTSRASYPYKMALTGLSYPFVAVTNEHRGDWPEKYTVQVSLVYYEKYDDGNGKYSFGYYSRTSMTNDVGGKYNEWVLDTLRDDGECVEDGYALMSVYRLSHIDYKVTRANAGNITNPDRMTFVGGSDYTTRVDATTTGFGLIAKPSTLRFDKIGDDGTVIDTMTASYIYIYQLPFALQETNRDEAGSFYDTFKLVAAYAPGSDTIAVHSGYTFYYCPHFAKNAINPDPEDKGAGSTYPGDPGSQMPIYVRSARQLNALGRYAYYWNPNNSGLGQLNFVQELDINFGTYTKKYCGVNFNLMDTSSGNIYRNRPIGRPGGQEFTNYLGKKYKPDNFQNRYNGRNNKIIDYRCIAYETDNYQFTGLFGEIESATLENIVLVASDPDAMSGYVISYYNKEAGSASMSGGVGALVGLVYTEYVSGSTSQVTQTFVKNCSVSGYTVIYYAGSETRVPNGNAAAGGLAGYNVGNIEGCSAVSSVVKIVVRSSSGNSKFFSVGGLAGVNFRLIDNCVAGTGGDDTEGLWIESRVKVNATIGGISGKAHYLWTSLPKTTATVSNSYSYCTIREQSADGVVYYGIAINVQSEATCIGSFSISNNYYLSDYVYVDVKAISGATPLTYDAKSTLFTKLPSMGEAQSVYRWGLTKQTVKYPFPTPTKDSDGSFVHYGDWPKNSDTLEGRFGLAKAGELFFEYSLGIELPEIIVGSYVTYTEGAPHYDDETYAYFIYATSNLNPDIVWEMNLTGISVSAPSGKTVPAEYLDASKYDIVVSKLPAKSRGYVYYRVTIFTLLYDPAGVTVDLTFTFDYKGRDVILKTQYTLPKERLSYNVVFIGFDGEVLETQTVYYGESATPPDVPQVLGYTFTGWRGDYTNVTSNLTVRADYRANTYTVKFNYYKSLIPTNDTVNMTQKFTYGTEQSLTAMPEANKRYRLSSTGAYYRFVGWNTMPDGTGVSYADGQTVMNLTAIDGGEITLYAQWKRIYAVTYHRNDGTGNAVIETLYYEPGDVVDTNSSFNITRNNYVFVGWSQKKSGWSSADDIYYPGDSDLVFIMGEADVELYAVWGQNKTISYKRNNNRNDNKTLFTQVVVTYSKVKLSSTIPTRNKYEFLGWATDRNAQTPEYAPGETIFYNGTYTELYAVWRSR